MSQLCRRKTPLCAFAFSGADHALATLLVMQEINPQEIVEAGGIDVFIKALGDAQQGTVSDALGAALLNLVTHDAAKHSLVHNTAALVGLLRKGNAAAKQHTSAVLASIASTDEGMAALCKADAPESLVSLAMLNRGSHAADDAVAILCRLASVDNELQALISAGAVLPLVNILRDGSESEQATAVAALRRLTGADKAFGGQQAAVDAGCVGLLVQLLGPGTWPAQSDAMH
eukprot:4970428-Pleurochrysis_carterae.AAC.1